MFVLCCTHVEFPTGRPELGGLWSMSWQFSTRRLEAGADLGGWKPLHRRKEPRRRREPNSPHDVTRSAPRKNTEGLLASWQDLNGRVCADSGVESVPRMTTFKEENLPSWVPEDHMPAAKRVGGTGSTPHPQ